MTNESMIMARQMAVVVIQRAATACLMAVCLERMTVAWISDGVGRWMPHGSSIECTISDRIDDDQSSVLLMLEPTASLLAFSKHKSTGESLGSSLNRLKRSSLRRDQAWVLRLRFYLVVVATSLTQIFFGTFM